MPSTVKNKSYYERIVELAANLSNTLSELRRRRLEVAAIGIQEAIQADYFAKEHKDKLYISATILCIVSIIALHGFLYYSVYSCFPIYEDKYSYTLCADGSISYSKGQGACSWHGGIDRYIYTKVEKTDKEVYSTECLIAFLLSVAVLTTLSFLSLGARKINWRVANWFIFTYPVLLLYLLFYLIAFTLIMFSPLILAALAAFYFLKIVIWEPIKEKLLGNIS